MGAMKLSVSSVVTTALIALVVVVAYDKVTGK